MQNGTTEEPRFVLGSSWVVISGVISKVAILITLIRGLITPLMTTHEPPSKVGQISSIQLELPVVDLEVLRYQIRAELSLLPKTE